MANNFKHKDISQIFDMVRDRDHYTVIRDFFELSAISIRNNFDHGPEHANLEKRYMEIAQGYKKEYLEGFATALGLLGKKIKDAVDGNAPFADWAGELYMDSGTSNGKAGQFFTPYSVSQCMARINFPKDDVMAKLGDIDPRCVHMTYVTLSLLGVPAVVRLGDALAMEYRQNWFSRLPDGMDAFQGSNRAWKIPEQCDSSEVKRTTGKAARSGSRAAKRRTPGTSHGDG